MNKFKILVTDPLSEKGLSLLTQDSNLEVELFLGHSEDEIVDKIESFDALLIRSGTRVTAKILEKAHFLKVIGRAGVGVDNIDLQEASRKGIIVMNTPLGNTLATAELTISHLLSLSRRLPQAYISLKEGRWDRKKYVGTEVYGKVLGLIGFGRIGREVAKRMVAFGMTIYVFDPFSEQEDVESAGYSYIKDIQELYKNADYITVHVPKTPQTEKMINIEAIQQMKKSVYLINCARGGVICEKSLIRALENNQIGGVALDVFESEPFENQTLLNFDNVVLTPHLGASTTEAQENVAIDVVTQVKNYLIHNKLKNAVNFRSVSSEVLKKTAHYIQLAEKIGFLSSFLAPQNQKIDEIEVHYLGQLTQMSCHHLISFFAKGFLKHSFAESVNEVNALFLLKERGIKTTEVYSNEEKDFVHSIRMVLKSKNEPILSIQGSDFGKDSRIVRINNFHVDLIPEGEVLFCRNKDVPGFVGEIGNILGEYGINIADLTIGRLGKGESALTVLNVDTQIFEEVLQKIVSLDKVKEAILVTFN